MPPYFYVSSLITYVCYHTNAAEALVALIVLIVACRNIEPLWGPLELTRFVAITSVAAGLCTSVVIYLIAALSPTWKETLFYSVQFHGFSPLFAAFGVAGKQLWSEMPLIASWTGVRLKTVPALLVGTHITLAMLGFRFSLVRMLPSLFGAVVAWCYLRFWQVTAGGMRGDSSDSFALSSFCPELLRVSRGKGGSCAVHVDSVFFVIRWIFVMCSYAKHNRLLYIGTCCAIVTRIAVTNAADISHAIVEWWCYNNAGDCSGRWLDIDAS
jgi:hypothetical protein